MRQRKGAQFALLAAPEYVGRTAAHAHDNSSLHNTTLTELKLQNRQSRSSVPRPAIVMMEMRSRRAWASTLSIATPGGLRQARRPARTTTFASPQGTTTRKGKDEGDLYTELHWSRGPRSWVGRAREQYGPSAEESCLPRYRNTFLPKTTKPGISQEQNLYLSR
jgi:hypothetical protein